MNPKKVLLITPHYTPDFGPSAPIFTALCEDLRALGWEMHVVTSFPHYAGADGWAPQPKKWFEHQTLNGVHIIRSYIYTVPRKALWRRLLYQASFNLFASLAALKVGKVDLVLADAPFLWDGLPLLVKAILPGLPFIYIVFDIFPDVLSQLGYLTNPHLIQLFERIERFYYHRAPRITVLSEGFRQNLIGKGVANEKITVIPVCVDVDFIQPMPPDPQLRAAWQLETQFVVLYAGNLGLSQGLETLLQAAQLLLPYPEITFVLVGEGASKEILQNKASEWGLPNVQFHSFLPRQKVPLLYSLADVGLVSLKKDIVMESVPSKTYTIMAAAKAVLATVDENTEVGCLLREAQCGLCVEPENPVSLAEAVVYLYQNPEQCREYGRRARAFVSANYSRQVASQQYDQLIQQLLSPDPAS